MKILIDDLATINNTTIASENSGFPLANLYSDGLVEKTLLTTTLDVDLGSAQLIDTIGTVDENLALRISGGIVVGGQSFTLDTDSTLITEVNFISETFQHWRVELLGAIVNVSPAILTAGDVFTKSPMGLFDQNKNFLPMNETGFPIGMDVGGQRWETSGVLGANVTITATASPAGDSFIFDLTQGGVGGWDTFADEPSGLKKTVFPSAATNDALGGFHEWFYNKTYFTHAFEDNFAPCIPATNGSVYKTSILNANLVVRWDGMSGPAGSATPDVLVDIARPMAVGAITPGLMNYLYIGNSLLIPAVRDYSTPNLNDTDAVARTSGHQIITTAGTFFQTQDFPVIGSSQAQYTAFLNWYKSSDRARNHLIVQFENSMDCSPFEPYYAKIFARFNERVNLAFDYDITTEEAK